MPNKLKLGTRRLSYIEENEVAKSLDILAAARGTNLSAVIREATKRYLQQEDPHKELTKVAKELVKQLPNESSQRASHSFDEATMEALAKIVKRFKK
jgi:hypothetical protein